jgi:hypothetical protein
MELHKIKKLQHNKSNGLLTEETTHRVGENICQLYIKGLKTRIFRELKKRNSPKINEQIKKWATELSQKKKKRLKWPKTREKKNAHHL